MYWKGWSGLNKHLCISSYLDCEWCIEITGKEMSCMQNDVRTHQRRCLMKFSNLELAQVRRSFGQWLLQSWHCLKCQDFDFPSRPLISLNPMPPRNFFKEQILIEWWNGAGLASWKTTNLNLQGERRINKRKRKTQCKWDCLDQHENNDCPLITGLRAFWRDAVWACHPRVKRGNDREKPKAKCTNGVRRFLL